jgi:integrase/recombinase XerC/integrase/recombinase XerD
MDKENVRKIIENFLSEMENAKKSRHTIVNYRSDLVHFLENCSSGIENLTVESLRNHIDGLNSKSPTTKARHVSSLTSFLNWCYRKDYIPSNPILKIDNQKISAVPVLQKIEKDSIQKIISSIEIVDKKGNVNVNNLKYRLLFTLIAEAGLKVSEALNLNIEDIETETLTVLIYSTPKRRVTLFSSESIKLLELYKAEANICSGFIFKGGETDSKSLSYQAVNRFWRKSCLKTSQNVTMQQLRDYYARELIKKGFNIDIVSKILGHKKIQTTVKYFQ